MVGLTKKKRGPKPSAQPVSERARLLGKRIEALRNKRGMNQTQLAEAAGVLQQALSKIERGRVNPDNPKARHTITKIAEYFGSRLGQTWINVPNRIKVVAYVAGGMPIVEDIEDQFVTVDPDLINLSGDVVGLRVKGDSMLENHIVDGDVLICRRTADPQRGSIIVADLKGERGATVKRWERKGDTIFLSSDVHVKDSEKQQFPTWALGKVLEVLGLVRRLI